MFMVESEIDSDRLGDHPCIIALDLVRREDQFKIVVCMIADIKVQAPRLMQFS
jgi:hypothetical protein